MSATRLHSIRLHQPYGLDCLLHLLLLGHLFGPPVASCGLHVHLVGSTQDGVDSTYFLPLASAACLTCCEACSKQTFLLFQVVQMRDSLGDGSGCTMLISAWRETLQPAVKHTRRQACLAAAQNASNDKAIIVQVILPAFRSASCGSSEHNKLTLMPGCLFCSRAMPQ